MTVKGARVGLTRPEFEYTISVGDAEEMLATLCDGSLVEKTRYKVLLGEHAWEVDEFHGDNAGLVLAEIELKHEAEFFRCPEWLGEEVSNDPRYYSATVRVSLKSPSRAGGNVQVKALDFARLWVPSCHACQYVPKRLVNRFGLSA